MTTKRLTLFPTPLDRDAFHHAYESTYIAAAQTLPGLVRWRCTVPIDGDPARAYHVIGELYFADRAALDAALASDAGQQFLREENALSTGGAPKHTIAIEHEGAPGDAPPTHDH